MLFLPYLVALKQHYSGILLDPSGVSPVDVSIKNPQKGFKDLNYPGIGLEYVTFVLNRDRIPENKRVANVSDTEAIVRKPLEPVDYLIYVHTFVQDSQAQDVALQQKVLEKTPYYFAVNVELFDGTYNCEIYREDIDNIVIEGMDKEIHNAYSLKVWGWLDTDPTGTTRKLVTQYPELRSVVGFDLTELPIPPI